MGVSAVRDELVAHGLELVLKSLGIVNHLLLVGLELGSVGLLESNSKRRDGVVVRATLVTGEDGEVDGILKLVQNLLASLGVDRAHTLAEEDHGTTRTTEGLVGSGGHDIGVLEGRGDDAGGDETGNVGDINNQVGADRVSDLAHASIVDQAAVGRGTGNEDLGTIETSVLLEQVVVDNAGALIDTVGHSLKVVGDSRDPDYKIS